MKNVKRDLPIYALSASLVFLGISISGNQASAAPSQVTSSEFSRLKMELSSFKSCANSNFREVMFFDATRNPRMAFIRTC
jgi:hypothetical protein